MRSSTAMIFSRKLQDSKKDPEYDFLWQGQKRVCGIRMAHANSHAACCSLKMLCLHVVLLASYWELCQHIEPCVSHCTAKLALHTWDWTKNLHRHSLPRPDTVCVLDQCISSGMNRNKPKPHTHKDQAHISSASILRFKTQDTCWHCVIYKLFCRQSTEESSTPCIIPHLASQKRIPHCYIGVLSQ